VTVRNFIFLQIEESTGANLAKPYGGPLVCR